MGAKENLRLGEFSKRVSGGKCAGFALLSEKVLDCFQRSFEAERSSSFLLLFTKTHVCVTRPPKSDLREASTLLRTCWLLKTQSTVDATTTWAPRHLPITDFSKLCHVFIFVFRLLFEHKIKLASSGFFYKKSFFSTCCSKRLFLRN